MLQLCLEFLLYAAPVGLALDVVGFVLIIRHGHALFIHTGTASPSPEMGKDGDLYFQYAGQQREVNDRQRSWAMEGVVMVVSGFVLQLIGSMAGIWLARW